MVPKRPWLHGAAGWKPAGMHQEHPWPTKPRLRHPGAAETELAGHLKPRSMTSCRPLLGARSGPPYLGDSPEPEGHGHPLARALRQKVTADRLWRKRLAAAGPPCLVTIGARVVKGVE